MTSTSIRAATVQFRAGLSGYVAEITAAFVCASLSIVPTVRHADYLGAWLDVLKEDNRAIIRAASAASKAADYLLAFAPNDPAVASPLPNGGGLVSAAAEMLAAA